jgi:hypothetical protein
MQVVVEVMSRSTSANGPAPAHAFERFPCLVAQVAARAAVEDDGARHRARDHAERRSVARACRGARARTRKPQTAAFERRHGPAGDGVGVLGGQQLARAVGSA